MWIDVAKFLLANYIAHAATVKLLPGESTLSVLRAIILSLLYPVSGVKRGVYAIYRCAILAKTPLQAAKKAGALCMVVRTLEWKPNHGDVVRILSKQESQEKPWWVEASTSSNRAKRVVAGICLRLTKMLKLFSNLYSLVMNWKILEDEDTSEVPAYVVQRDIPVRDMPSRQHPDWEFQPSSSSWDLRSRAIHGVCQLPSGYALCTVPTEFHVVELGESQQGGGGQPGRNQAGVKDKAKDGDHGDGKVMAMSLSSRFKLQTLSNLAARKSSLDNTRPSPIQLSSVKNLAKGLIAVFQTVYASLTLYHARGDQIQHYGYAAFGLTVVPYIVMSLINLASIILTPDYPVMYLVESEAMREANKRQNAKFDGVIGKILTTSSSSNESYQDVKFDINSNGRMAVLACGSDAQIIKVDEEAEVDGVKFRTDPWTGVITTLPIRRPIRIISRSSELPQKAPGSGKLIIVVNIVALSSIAIIGALSHFKPNQSTRAQRVWTMMWLALGTASDNVGTGRVLILLPYSVPSIGGFVVVSQMIMHYGNCVKLG